MVFESALELEQRQRRDRAQPTGSMRAYVSNVSAQPCGDDRSEEGSEGEPVVATPLVFGAAIAACAAGAAGGRARELLDRMATSGLQPSSSCWHHATAAAAAAGEWRAAVGASRS